MKPCRYSGQSGKRGQKGEDRESKTMILPNQLTADDNKALGLSYTIESDNLHIMVAVNFSKKKKNAPCSESTRRRCQTANT